MMNKFTPIELSMVEEIASLLLRTNSVISNSNDCANIDLMLLAHHLYKANLQYRQDLNTETILVELFTSYIWQKFARNITNEEYAHLELTELQLLAISKERELYSAHYADPCKKSSHDLSQYILDVMQIYTLNRFILSKIFTFSPQNNLFLDLSAVENAIATIEQDIACAKARFSKIKISENKYLRIVPANTYYITMLSNGLSNILDYCNQLRILSIDTSTLTDDINFEDHALQTYRMIHQSIQYHTSANEPMTLPNLAIANKITELANFYFSPNPSTAKIFFSSIQTCKYRWRLQSAINSIEAIEEKLAAITFFKQFVTNDALNYANRLEHSTFSKYFAKLSERDLCNYIKNFEHLRTIEETISIEETCLQTEAHRRFGNYWYEHCKNYKRKHETKFTEDVRPAI